jgi:hypothetical protein
MRTLTAFAAFLACALLAGCSSGPTLAEVKGRVTMNGKPLGNVRVDFHPDPDKGTTGAGSSGTTDADGNFALKFGDGRPGAIVGHHRVILTDLDVFGTVFVGRGDYRTEDPKGPKETPKKARFPDVNSDLARTPHRFEVKPGMEPVTIDVKK